MRVVLQTEGGIGAFPGLAAAFACDGESLPAEESRQLASLVERSGLLEPGAEAEPAASPGQRRGADRRRYVLAIEHGGRRRTAVFEDPLPANVAALVAFVRQKQRQQGGAHDR